MTTPIVVDSSGWLEYFADGHCADMFASAVLAPEQLVVPATTVYEVFRVSLRESNLMTARLHAAAMLRSPVDHIDAELAIAAAQLADRHALGMADATILAATRRHRAQLWTMDSDFAGLEDVRIVAR